MNAASLRKFLLPAILVFGVLLRVYWFAYDPSMWTAEHDVSLSVVKYDIRQLATQPLVGEEMAPFGFLAGQKLFGALGGYREWSLRLFPLLCGVAALLLFARLARELLTGAPLLVAVGLFSFCAPLIFHSSEMKQYAGENLAAVVVMGLALRLRHGMTFPQAVAAGAICAVCVWFSFTSVFVIAGSFSAVGINFLRQGKFRQVACVTVVSIMPLVSFLAYYLLLIVPHSSVATQKMLNAPFFAPLPVSLPALGWYVRTAYLALGDPFGLSLDADLPFLPHASVLKWLISFSYPAAILGLVGIYRLGKNDRYLSCLLGFPLAFALAASLLKEYPLRERHWVFFIPAVCLLLGHAVEPLRTAQATTPRWRRLALPALLIWAAGYVFINLGAKVADPPLFAGRKYSTFREAVQYIAANQQKGDVVIVMWNAELLYEYYDYLYHLNWNVVSGSDPNRGAHSLAEVRAHMRQVVDSNAAARPRTWYLLVGVYQPIIYTDEQGVEHDTQVPTADVYGEVLRADENGKIAAQFTGPGAAAYLLESAPK